MQIEIYAAVPAMFIKFDTAIYKLRAVKVGFVDNILYYHLVRLIMGHRVHQVERINQAHCIAAIFNKCVS
jgi:hypothetical protein